nr:nucleotide kinase domain-containing protein [Saccharospirillum impatiens]
MLKKSELLDFYWSFAYKRQQVFLHRISPTDVNLTLDPIISKYKFTNCYRSCDRVSQYLIKNIINSSEYSPQDTFFRILCFKLFNKIDTWEFLSSKLGEISISTYKNNDYAALIDQYIALKGKPYSGAYIMPSGKKEFGFERKHRNNFALLDLVLKNNLQEKIWLNKTLDGIYCELIELPTLGPFLAYQFSVDVAYSEYSSAEESDFVVAGPGAIRGIKKCFTDIGNMTYQDVIKHMASVQDEEFERLGLPFNHLQNRKLQLIDCQNLFCEIDKYLRVLKPDLVVGNKRIKQLYRPSQNNIEYGFPKKWNCALPQI